MEIIASPFPWASLDGGYASFFLLSMPFNKTVLQVVHAVVVHVSMATHAQLRACGYSKCLADSLFGARIKRLLREELCNQFCSWLLASPHAQSA